MQGCITGCHIGWCGLWWGYLHTCWLESGGENKARQVWGQVGMLSGRCALWPSDWVGQRRRGAGHLKGQTSLSLSDCAVSVWSVGCLPLSATVVAGVAGHRSHWGRWDLKSWAMRVKCTCWICLALCRYRTTKDITLPFRVIPLVRLSSQNHMEIKVRLLVTLTTPLTTTHPPSSPPSTHLSCHLNVVHSFSSSTSSSSSSFSSSAFPLVVPSPSPSFPFTPLPHFSSSSGDSEVLVQSSTHCPEGRSSYPYPSQHQWSEDHNSEREGQV